MNDPLVTMLEARSVAVVGASPKEGSFGWHMLRQLEAGGFDGQVHPINPSYEQIGGRICLPSVASLPGPVDLVLLGVRNSSLEEQLQAAADSGARSAVIFGSCWEAPRPGVSPLPERLASIARTVGMAICGGNGMGFLNIERGLRACGFSEPGDLLPGPITFISHSGSVFSAMLHNDRRLRFNLVVSPGTELVNTTDQYLRYALDRPSTRVVGLFIETFRRPAEFRQALEVAAERDIPVIALKVGREGRARELVQAHSGALAGEDGAYEALFDAHGVLRVETLDEMCDTLELFAAGRRAAPGGLASAHDSGGERAHLIDAAADAGVPFARISQATEDALVSFLDEGLPAVNPLDAWGTGNDADHVFVRCLHALAEDPDTGALAFCVDLTTELESETHYTDTAKEVFGLTRKPLAVLSNVPAAIDPGDAAILREFGVPVLEGTRTGLAAFRHLFDHRDFRALPPLDPPEPVTSEVRDVWRQRLSEDSHLTEVEGLNLLRDYGLDVVRAEPATSMDQAVSVAERIGYPVALKTAAPGVLHKTEADGVRLGLSDRLAVEETYADLASRLGQDVTVAAMASPGVELALGIVRDQQFGPLVVVAAGGLLVEVLRDRRLAMPPLDQTRGLRLLDRLAVRPLLDGTRGRSPADLEALSTAIVRLSVLAVDLGDLIDELDVNPVIAGPGGCVAVDALVVPRR